MLILQYKSGGVINTAFWDAMHADHFTVGWLGNDAGTEISEYYDAVPITNLPSGFQFQAGTAPTGHKAFKLTGSSDSAVTLQTGYSGWDTNVTAEFLMKFDGTPTNTSMHLFSKNSYFAGNTTDFPLVISANYTTGVITAQLSHGNDYSFDYTLTLNNLSQTEWNHIAIQYDETGTNTITLVCNGQTTSTAITTPLPTIKGTQDFSIGGTSFAQSGGVDTVFADNTLWSHIGVYRYQQPTISSIVARYSLL